MSSWSLLSYFFPSSSPPSSSPIETEEAKEPPQKPSMDDYSLAESRTLGSGADGSVVSATHIATGRRVALKIIQKAKRRPDQLDRSRTEGRLISSVFDHPNIIKGFPLIEDDTLLVIPMELATMGDLLDHVNNRRGFSEPEARDIFRQILDGLAHAHAKNILHGDIKLENIVIFPPSKEQVKRGDFGRRFAICDWGYSRLDTGEVIKKAFGSLLYSSPEIVSGTGHFSKASDVWGLGVILYALIYATLPFGGRDTRQHIASALYNFPPEVPVSPDCKDLISSILRISPSQRLTIDQIRAHPWLAGRPAQKPIAIPAPKAVHSSESNCSPLSSAPSSASTVSVASKDSDQLAPTESVLCLSSKEPPCTPAAARHTPACTAAATTKPAQHQPPTGCWYLGGDELELLAS